MVTALEVAGPVVAVVAMPLEVVAVAVAMVAVVIPVVMMVMPRPVLVQLRGRRAGEQHESGDQTCNAELHRAALSVQECMQVGRPALNWL